MLCLKHMLWTSLFSSAFLLIQVIAPPSLRAAATYKILYGFTGGADGGALWGSVALDKKGNLYGVTSGGGANGYGTVFKLAHEPGNQWVEKVLYSFSKFGADGSIPNGGLTLDSAGHLFGTTWFGGSHNGGTVFELSDPPAWVEDVLYSFGDNPDDAGFPYAGLVIDNAGNLYGTAPAGGPNGSGGTVYQIVPEAGGWTENILYGFCSKPDCADGGGPYAGVILDAKGNLYGITEGGGAQRAGVVFKLRHMPDGSWTERVLHSFGSFPEDGRGPGVGGLSLDSSGNLYGTTGAGGKHSCGNANCGTIFRLTRQPNGHWKETILYNFQQGTLGFWPGAGVVVDSLGNLYGTTLYGGAACGCGVVYKLEPNPDNTWTYTVLHSFTGADGADPDANLILDDKGNLYGTTSAGGPGGFGVVFELTP